MDTLYDVTIIIPVYNTSRWLDECLSSVIAQSLRNIQIICINDCSTDDSLRIIEDYVKKDDRVSLINRLINGGQAVGRNQGLAQAQGRYIFFLDSDDAIKGVDMLSTLVHLADKCNLDAIVFDSEYMADDEKMLSKFRPDNESLMSMDSDRILSGQEAFNQIMSDMQIPCQLGRWFWKKDFLRENSLIFPEDSSPHEDVYFYFSAVLHINRMIYIRNKFHLRRYRVGSVMTELSDKSRIRDFKSYYVVLDKCLSFLHNSNRKLWDEKTEKNIQEFINVINGNMLHSFKCMSTVDRNKVVFDDYKYEITDEGVYPKSGNSSCW